MTHQEKLSFIREKCIEANPEIIGLDVAERKWEESFYESQWNVNTVSIKPEEESFMQDMSYFMPRHMPVYDWNLPYNEFILLKIRRHLLKRPIRLADVLATVSQKWHKDQNGYWVFFGDEKSIIVKICAMWVLLKDDLTLQSEETIDFIYQLLAK